MSLRGRYVIDRIKRATSGYLKLPVPPYQNPSYWEGVYRTLGPRDSFEWGALSYHDNLKQYTFQSRSCPRFGIVGNTRQSTTTLRETLNVLHSHEKTVEQRKQEASSSGSNSTVMMLGCGNSRLGEEMLEDNWPSPIVQIDVSSRVVATMRERCARWIEVGHMELVQDDATLLSAFGPSQTQSVLDKGLVDALFCANDRDQCYDVLKSAHRVLVDGGRLVVCSFSEPEFILDSMLLPRAGRTENLWQDVQIQEMNNMLLYVFHKHQVEPYMTANARR